LSQKNAGRREHVGPASYIRHARFSNSQEHDAAQASAPVKYLTKHTGHPVHTQSAAPSLSISPSEPVTEDAAPAVAAEDKHGASGRLPLRHRLDLTRLVPRALLLGRRLGRGLQAHVSRVLGAWLGLGLGLGLGSGLGLGLGLGLGSGSGSGSVVRVRVSGQGQGRVSGPERTVARDQRDPTMLLAGASRQ
jgi:hypothetical protein